MKRHLALLLCVAGLGGGTLPAQTQNPAAAAAERQEFEEQIRRLNAAVEELIAAQAVQQKKIAALTEEVRRLRDEPAVPAGKYATAAELNYFSEALRELDKKREADKEKILTELNRQMDKLEKSLNAAPARPRTPPKKAAEAAPVEKPAAETGKEMKGLDYLVKKGDNLRSIVAAHNEEFKKQGMKTVTVQQVLDANPGLNPTKMKISQKIFIPLPQ